jgi:hypothetical protein
MTDKNAKYAAHGVAKKQDRRWVDRKVKQGQFKAVLKHALSHHVGRDGLCECGYSDQELVDLFDWSHPTHNAFYYETAYRSYPRLIKKTQHLDHSAYARMYAGYHPVPKVLSFFATSGARLSTEEIESILDARFGGSLWNDPEMREWVLNKSPSARSGMLNRWRKCPFIKSIVDALAVAEVMMA